MKNKYNQELPKNVEEQLDAYIERIKVIQWFKPKSDLKRSEIDAQINLALKAFGVEAGIEYRKLETPEDWDASWNASWDASWDAAWDASRGASWNAAWDASWNASWGAAWDAAWDASRGASWNAAWDASRDASWGIARDAAWGAADILALNLDEYKNKYPNGNFINLIPLYEAGLYPVGVIDGKFVVYVPATKTEFPNELV